MRVDLEKFKGIFMAMYSAYDDNGNVDKERVKKLARYYADKKVKGLYVGGSSGEGVLQSEEERKQVVEAVMEEVGKELTIIVHVGANSTPESVRLAQHAAKMGADAGIGGTYGVMPELFMKLNEYMNNQEIDKARELQNEVNEIIKGLLSVGSLYGACKYILHLRGVETGVPRLPMLPITDEAVKEKLQKLNKTIEDLIEKVK